MKDNIINFPTPQRPAPKEDFTEILMEWAEKAGIDIQDQEFIMDSAVIMSMVNNMLFKELKKRATN